MTLGRLLFKTSERTVFSYLNIVYRDLLEWNGYEIINDVVIHSRLVVDTTSVVTHEEEWQDNDTVSDVNELSFVKL